MGKNNPREIKARRERELQAAASSTSDDMAASSSDVGTTGGLDVTGGQPVTGGLNATGNQPIADNSLASDQSQMQANPAAQSAALQETQIQGDFGDSGEITATPDLDNLESLNDQDVQSDQDVQDNEDSQEAQDNLGDAQLPVIDGSTIQSYEVRERKPIDVRKVIKRVFIALIIIIVAAVVCIIVSFSVYRWNMYDDAADFVGVWQVEGSDSTIEITDEAIKLTDDIAYKYVLDEDAKTISFIFGNLTGEGHYRFSLDRNKLAIIDGEWDWNQSLTEDAQWTKDALVEQYINNGELDPYEGYDDKNVTALKKISSS